MNGLKVFTNEEFGDVAVISIDNKPYFEGIKVARILGYKNPNDAIKRHCKYPGIVFHDTRIQTGRRRDGTESFQIVQRAFISEGNLYRLIVKSKKEEAEKFESWVMDEVLPSIRNDGGYVNDETFLVKVLDSYLKQKTYCEKLINDLNNYKPYINIGQTVAQSDDSISIGAFAKLLNSLGLDIGRNRLFQWFRENGYIMKQNGENQPKQVYIDMGLFKTRQMAITTSEGIAIKVTTYVTGKGQLYFIKKLKGDFLDEEVCGYF
nr:phage antirepressor KilAC domain-containing protein [uncultured Romboutsia sp.]